MKPTARHTSRRNPDRDIEVTMSDFSNEFVAEFVFYAGRRKVDGTLILTTIDADDLDRECLRNLERLRSRHDDQSISALMVSNVRVEPEARRTGVGLALYEAAAKFARDRFNAAIVANDCYGGQTSDDAKGLWDSSKLASSLDVYGHVALWRHKAKRVEKTEEAKAEAAAKPVGATPERADRTDGSASRTALRTSEGTFYIGKHVDSELLNVFRWPRKRSHGDLSYADWLGSVDVAEGNVYINSSTSNGRYVGHDKADARRRMLRAVVTSLRSSEKNPPDELRVTFVDADGTRIPAVVHRLLTHHFDVHVPAHENASGARVAAQTIRFGYNGEVSGTHGRRSKRREHRRGPGRVRSLATGDIARVRVASGRSPG